MRLVSAPSRKSVHETFERVLAVVAPSGDVSGTLLLNFGICILSSSASRKSCVFHHNSVIDVCALTTSLACPERSGILK